MKLTDIVAFKRTIRVGEQSVDVRGLTVTDIATLLDRFPELSGMFDGVAIDTKTVVSLAQPLAAAIIAAGSGSLGDAEQEQAAALLPVGVQTEFIGAILELTLPNGIGPFVERMTSLGIVLGRGVPGREPDTTSQSPSSG